MVMVRGAGATCRAPRRSPKQVAKNFLLTNERSFDRKMKEALLSFRNRIGLFERRRILELYLNEILPRPRQLRRRRRRAELFRQVGARAVGGPRSPISPALPKGPKQLPAVSPTADKAIDRPQLGSSTRMVENGLRPAARTATPPSSSRWGVTSRVLSPNTYYGGFFAEEVRRELGDKYGEKKALRGRALGAHHARPEDAEHRPQGAGRRAWCATTRPHGFRGPDAPTSRDRRRLGARPLAEVQALGRPSTPWRLAVVLELNGNDAQIGPAAQARPRQQRQRRPRDRAPWCRAAGLHWSKGIGTQTA